MTKALKKRLLLILSALAVFVLALALPLQFEFKTALLILSYLVAGLPVLRKAFRNLRQGQVFDENFLMMIATFGAFYLKDYAEAAAVMLFYQIGEFFQSYAVNQSRKSIAKLMDIRPDYAHVLRNGKPETVDPEDVVVGEVILIQPGERIPLDGKVIDGVSTIDTAALTGESLPRDVEKGDDVISGCINLTGVLQVNVIKEFSNSTVAKILDLVENASSQKADVENFITRFARYYTPAVVIIALLLAIVPPLTVAGQSFHEWLYRAITFLVISCPCALVISIPLSFFGGLGAASKCGVLIKGSNYLEALSHAEIVVFDKTGTLTKGNFKLAEIFSEDMEPEKLLEYAAFAEAYSKHPIADAIKLAYAKEIDLQKIENPQEMHGYGLTAIVNGDEVSAGNERLMAKTGISVKEPNAAGTVVHIAVNGKYAGHLLIADEIKEDAAPAVELLKKHGVKQTVMLTGDRKAIGEETAAKLGLDKVYCELLPVDKVSRVEELLAQKPAGRKLLFVGDGINDAPVLARSDIGIAMGGVGSDAAIEAADVVIMNDEPSKIAAAINISKRTMHIVRQNIVFAIGVKFLVLGFGAAGFVSIWAAVFADVGVSVIAILNAMRALFFHTQR